jgi:hypothetical protein
MYAVEPEAVVFPEKSWCPMDDTMMHYVVDLSFLISCCEPGPRPRGWPYARAPRGENVHTVVVVSGLRYG